MKKKLIYILLSLAVASGLFAGEPKSVLLVYEENNEQIDPWLDLFRNDLSEKNYRVDECSASAAGARNLTSYDYILIYGAVMAFTMKEPVREWLQTEPSLDEKDVLLFVTASRWFVKKYTNQLISLISEQNGNLVDVVSSATNELTTDEKKTLVSSQVNRLR